MLVSPIVIRPLASPRVEVQSAGTMPQRPWYCAGMTAARSRRSAASAAMSPVPGVGGVVVGLVVDGIGGGVRLGDDGVKAGGIVGVLGLTGSLPLAGRGGQDEDEGHGTKDSSHAAPNAGVYPWFNRRYGVTPSSG